MGSDTMLPCSGCSRPASPTARRSWPFWRACRRPCPWLPRRSRVSSLGVATGTAAAGGRRLETDALDILSGVRHGRTLGSPIAITIPNNEWEAKYRDLMAVEGEGDPADRLTRPRPGHADLAGAMKYGFDDVRNVLERASARETAARVAIGSVCKAFLAELDIRIVSHVVRIGKVAVASVGPSARTGGPRCRGRVAGPVLRRRRGGEDGRRDRSRPEGTGHGGRRVRGDRVRMSAGPRLPRPLRPQARRTSRARRDEHPVGEGCRRG